MEFFKLTQQEVKEYTNIHNTPLLVLSIDQIETNYNFLKDYLPTVKIHYAVKSNPNQDIIRKLIELGSCFDVASDGEILDLIAMGISPDRMIYANPVKTPKGLAAARLAGVYKFTYDSESEIYKMAEHVPGSTVLLRVRINNSDAMIDLNKKFGANPEEAIHLLRLARDNGLNVAGLCFHVGSGSLSVKSYINALVTCRHIFDEAKCHGFDMKYLDIGGGFTSLLNDQEVDIANILSTLNVALAGYFPGVEIWSEPGRFICSTAMNLITSVIGVTVRDNNKWYFLDEGLYGTFSGIAFDHWEPELITFKDIEKIPITFAGPSCDSMDILMRDKLVEPLNIGETILVPNCGAYSVVTATNFNGFEKAKIIIHK